MSSHLVLLSVVASPTAEDMAIDTGAFVTGRSKYFMSSRNDDWVPSTGASFVVSLSGVCSCGVLGLCLLFAAPWTALLPRLAVLAFASVLTGKPFSMRDGSSLPSGTVCVMSPSRGSLGTADPTGWGSLAAKGGGDTPIASGLCRSVALAGRPFCSRPVKGSRDTMRALVASCFSLLQTFEMPSSSPTTVVCVSSSSTKKKVPWQFSVQQEEVQTVKRKKQFVCIHAHARTYTHTYAAHRLGECIWLRISVLHIQVFIVASIQ